MIDCVEKYSELFGENDDIADVEAKSFHQKLSLVKSKVRDVFVSEFKPYYEERLGEQLSDEDVIKVIQMYPLSGDQIIA
jgi:hypothetical protein